MTQESHFKRQIQPGGYTWTNWIESHLEMLSESTRSKASNLNAEFPEHFYQQIYWFRNMVCFWMLATKRWWCNGQHWFLPSIRSGFDSRPSHIFFFKSSNAFKVPKVLRDGESNPGLPRDRRGYSPLYYRGVIMISS